MPTCTLDQVRRYVGNGVRMLMVRAVPDGEKTRSLKRHLRNLKILRGALSGSYKAISGYHASFD